ncbi:hypothetical protein Acr_23g0009050 [Actinidia rufa]|uniref:Uncharacterized protein n=1 Tax=Actinidia rufa TaxID=165716 RepID=A0A7J0GNZ8_9ERIC|nr:hypothetical protein Acr_23g0009050 [Actinidia rufa]
MEGGRGFKNLEAWNFALLSRNLWNIHAKKDNLWVRWIHQKYLQNSYIWYYIRSNQDSELMKQLLIIRDMIMSKEGSVQAAINRMELWDRDEQFSTKSAYEHFRPWKINLTWPKAGLEDLYHPQTFLYPMVWQQIKQWLGITRAMNTLKAAVKWTIKEARGTGAQAKAKQIGLDAQHITFGGLKIRGSLKARSKTRKPLLGALKSRRTRVIYNLYPDLSGLWWTGRG